MNKGQVLKRARRDPEFRRKMISRLKKANLEYTAQKVKSFNERGFFPISKTVWKIKGPDLHYVVTSDNGEEVFVFKSDINGKILNGLELPGSSRDSSHGEAIQGYLESLNGSFKKAYLQKKSNQIRGTETLGKLTIYWSVSRDIYLQIYLEDELFQDYHISIIKNQDNVITVLEAALKSLNKEKERMKSQLARLGEGIKLNLRLLSEARKNVLES